MKPFIIATPAGQFRVRGHRHTGRVRPALVVVTGLFPRDDAFDHLLADFPGANVFIVDTPGAGTPWPEVGVEDTRAALPDLLAVLVGDAPLVLMGASTGNLLTLGAHPPNLCRSLALEPFLTTGPLWPLRDWARQFLADNPRAHGTARYLWRTFGIGPERAEDRDYRAFARAIAVPTDVIVGPVALAPPRELAGWPSLTSADDRATLGASPLVTLHSGPASTGHGLADATGGPALIRSIAHAALLAAAERCG